MKTDVVSQTSTQCPFEIKTIEIFFKHVMGMYKKIQTYWFVVGGNLSFFSSFSSSDVSFFFIPAEKDAKKSKWSSDEFDDDDDDDKADNGSNGARLCLEECPIECPATDCPKMTTHICVAYK